MFDNLTDKLQRVFKNLRGQGKLTEEHVDEALAVLEPQAAYGRAIREALPDDGIVVAGAKMLATGSALTHATFVAQNSAVTLDKDKAKELDGLWILEEREVGGKEVNVGDDGLFIEDGVGSWTNQKGTAPAEHKAKIQIDPSKKPATWLQVSNIPDYAFAR